MVNGYNIIVASGSDVGKIRETNQDNYLLGNYDSSKPVLLTLFDGAGGHAGGEVASGCGAEASRQIYSGLENYLEDENLANAGEKLVTSIAFETQKQIIKEVADMTKKDPTVDIDPTTTYVGLFFNPIGIANYAHVGDSRLYLLRDGKLQRLTDDHNIAFYFLNEKAKKENKPFDEEAFKAHHMNNQITKYICKDNSRLPDGKLTVGVSYIDIQEGDLYLLCSDGLTDMLNERSRRELDSQNGKITIRSIEEMLNQTITPGVEISERKLKQCVNSLIYEANRAGGKDNITVVLARVNQIIEPFNDQEEGFFNDQSQQASSEGGRLPYDELEDKYRKVYNAYREEHKLRRNLEKTTLTQGDENARLTNAVKNLELTVESLEFERSNLETDLAEKEGNLKILQIQNKGLEREVQNYKNNPHKQGRNPRIVGLLAGVALTVGVIKGSQYWAENDFNSNISGMYDSLTLESVDNYVKEANTLMLQHRLGQINCGELRMNQDSLDWNFRDDEVYVANPSELELFQGTRTELSEFVEDKCPRPSK